MQTVSKEEQKEVNMKLKEDQTRKIASLGVQYDNTIKKMISEQTVHNSILMTIVVFAALDPDGLKPRRRDTTTKRETKQRTQPPIRGKHSYLDIFKSFLVPNPSKRQSRCFLHT